MDNLNKKQVIEKEEIEYQQNKKIKKNYDSNLDYYSDDLSLITRLTKEEEKELFSKLNSYEKGSDEYIELRNKIVEANLPLSFYYAKEYFKKYPIYGLNYSDLIQESNMALMKAVEGFDLSKKTAFSTYFYMIANRDYHRILQRLYTIISLPYSDSNNIWKVLKVRSDLHNKLGEEPSYQALANELDMDKEHLKELLNAIDYNLSLDTFGGEEELYLADIIEDPNEDIEGYLDNIGLRNVLDKNLKKIPEKQEEYIRRYYGLNEDGIEEKQKEIAKSENLINQTISLDIKNGITKLRKTPLVVEAKDYYDYEKPKTKKKQI